MKGRRERLRGKKFEGERWSNGSERDREMRYMY